MFVKVAFGKWLILTAHGTLLLGLPLDPRWKGWYDILKLSKLKKRCSCRSGQSVLCAGDSGLWKICRHNVSILELQKNSGLLDIGSLILRHCYYFYGIFSVCHLGALRLDLQERHRVQKVMGHVACCSYETLSGPSIRYLSVDISVLFSTWKTLCLRSAEVPWWFQFGSIDLHQRSGFLILCFFLCQANWISMKFPNLFLVHFYTVHVYNSPEAWHTSVVWVRAEAPPVANP